MDRVALNDAVRCGNAHAGAGVERDSVVAQNGRSPGDVCAGAGRGRVLANQIPGQGVARAIQREPTTTSRGNVVHNRVIGQCHRRILGKDGAAAVSARVLRDHILGQRDRGTSHLQPTAPAVRASDRSSHGRVLGDRIAAQFEGRTANIEPAAPIPLIVRDDIPG